MRATFQALLTVAILSACTAGELPMTQTPSGRPEVTFPTRNLALVSEKLVGLCAQKGILVQKSEMNEVICGGTMEGGSAILAQMMIGNSYSTTPSQLVRFTIFPYQSGTRVQAYQWIETQMAFGQVNRSEMNSASQFNSIMQALISVGGKPVGNTTPAVAAKTQ